MNTTSPAYRAAEKIDPTAAQFARQGVPFAILRLKEIAEIIEAEYAAEAIEV